MEIKDLEIILKEHSEVIGDTRRLVNLLKDCFPEEQKNIRLLGNALEVNILQQIRTNQLDKVLYMRLCKQLTEEFSLQSDKVSWAVDTWIRTYGGRYA